MNAVLINGKTKISSQPYFRNCWMRDQLRIPSNIVLIQQWPDLKS